MYGITGGTGFLGQALINSLEDAEVCSFGRTKVPGASHTWFDLTEQTSINSDSLKCVEVLIHCAARVHVMNELATDSLPKFRQVNVQGTLNLARQAAACGVKRFIFVSSIKVNGEETPASQPFHFNDTPKPQDPYGVSKMEAERALRDLGQTSGMEIVIIRPPLIYGPGVKANFQKLLRLVDVGVPLPLGGVKNSRSLVGLDNLVDLIKVCCTHSQAANKTFLVSDNDDVSTSELVRRISRGFDKKARLIPIPEGMLRLAGSVMGKSEQVQRLCSNLQVDVSTTMQTLNWSPPFSMQEQLNKTVEDYKQRIR